MPVPAKDPHVILWEVFVNASVALVLFFVIIFYFVRPSETEEKQRRKPKKKKVQPGEEDEVNDLTAEEGVEVQDITGLEKNGVHEVEGEEDSSEKNDQKNHEFQNDDESASGESSGEQTSKTKRESLLGQAVAKNEDHIADAKRTTGCTGRKTTFDQSKEDDGESTDDDDIDLRSIPDDNVYLYDIEESWDREPYYDRMTARAEVDEQVERDRSMPREDYLENYYELQHGAENAPTVDLLNSDASSVESALEAVKASVQEAENCVHKTSDPAITPEGLRQRKRAMEKTSATSTAKSGTSFSVKCWEDPSGTAADSIGGEDYRSRNLEDLGPWSFLRGYETVNERIDAIWGNPTSKHLRSAKEALKKRCSRIRIARLDGASEDYLVKLEQLDKRKERWESRQANRPFWDRKRRTRNDLCNRASAASSNFDEIAPLVTDFPSYFIMYGLRDGSTFFGGPPVEVKVTGDGVTRNAAAETAQETAEKEHERLSTPQSVPIKIVEVSPKQVMHIAMKEFYRIHNGCGILLAIQKHLRGVFFNAVRGNRLSSYYIFPIHDRWVNIPSEGHMIGKVDHNCVVCCRRDNDVVGYVDADDSRDFAVTWTDQEGDVESCLSFVGATIQNLVSPQSKCSNWGL